MTKSLQGAINERQETAQVMNIYQKTCVMDIVCAYSGLNKKSKELAILDAASLLYSYFGAL